MNFMAKAPLTGSRIRSLRIDKGVRQAELARLCDISASYLNLIEHNRRRIGGALLVKIAQALDVDPSYISGVAEVRIAAEMDQAAQAHSDITIERARAEELSERFPGWARLIAAQHREIRRLEQVVDRLGDRLTHDPFLSASMHNVLTSVTAIRSASAILVQGGEIEPEWEARFHRNIYEDSQKLTEATEELVGYLDSDLDTEEGVRLPQDDLDRWLSQIGWRIDALEDNVDADLEEIVGAETAFSSVASQNLALSFLRRYAADARAIPLPILAEAVQGGAVPADLAQRFGVSLPVVFRRLATLGQEELGETEPFGLVACDASGTLVYRKPLPGFDLPRYSAACPFWPLFKALQRPMIPLSETLQMSGRDEGQFRAIAISDVQHPAGYNGPAISEAWMLFQPAFGEAIDMQRVGTSCRICSETACLARREPSVFS